MELEVEEISSTKDLFSLKKEWSELLQSSGNNNIFLTHEWISTWWKHFGNERELKLILAKKDGKIEGIAPLFLEKRFLLKVLTSQGRPYSDYFDFIVAPEYRKDVLKIVFEHFFSEKNWDVLDLRYIREDALIYRYLYLIGDKLLARKSNVGYTHIIRLPTTWEEFYSKMGKSTRKKMNRQFNYLNKNFQVEFEESTDKEIKKDMKLLVKLHAKRWEEKGLKGIFTSKSAIDFFMDVAEKFNENNWLFLRKMLIDGSVVAIHFNFLYKNRMYLYQGGWDPEWAKYSVNSLLIADDIKRAIGLGCREFDFLRGREEYKIRWHVDLIPLYKIHIFRSKLSSWLLNFLGK